VILITVRFWLGGWNRVYTDKTRLRGLNSYSPRRRTSFV